MSGRMGGEQREHDSRLADVWTQLQKVTDPELDESLTELGFIEDVEIEGDGSVDVKFRLPTYWCSPNFAFLMADDIRRFVSDLDWVREVRPAVQDHMFGDEVNRGVRLGLSFGEVFSQFGAQGTLEELREKFQHKAFERRQEAVIAILRKGGYVDATIAAMDLATLDALDHAALGGAVEIARYREILLQRGLARQPDDPAFVTLEGSAVDPAEFAAYMQRLRGVRINMEFNSALCRGLRESRYKGVGDRPRSSVTETQACGEGCGSSCASKTELVAPLA